DGKAAGAKGCRPRAHQHLVLDGRAQRQEIDLSSSEFETDAQTSNPGARRWPRVSRTVMGRGRRSLRRDGLQYFDDGVSGSAYRSFLRRTNRLHDLSADWELRR